MTIQNRLIVMVAVAVISSILYGAARYYSPSLVLHVVEQTLIQKAPAGTNSVWTRERLHDLLAATPDQNARMARLLHISGQLEKIQTLTSQELEGLLETGEKP
jgi:hypothetical protein